MIGQRTFRIEPQLPVQAMKTYALSAPLATHYRKALCAEVDCPAYLNGWKTLCDESDAAGAQRAQYIRYRSLRRFVESREGGITTFTFYAGQRCFASDRHVVPLEREAIYTVRDGDFRGNPTGANFTHTRASDWVDDFANHQDRINDAFRRG